MKGEAGMVTGVPPLLPKLFTRTLLGVLNAASSVHVAGEAILSRESRYNGKKLWDTVDVQNTPFIYKEPNSRYRLTLSA